jgi:hypothetical protein
VATARACPLQERHPAHPWDDFLAHGWPDPIERCGLEEHLPLHGRRSGAWGQVGGAASEHGVGGAVGLAFQGIVAGAHA